MPVDPAYPVVLAVGVVVAELRPAHLIACDDMGHALGDEKGRKHAALFLLSLLVDLYVSSRSLGAAVVGEVLGCSVPVLLQVRLVVPFIVADHVSQGEAVVVGDEVDAGVYRSDVLRVNVP